MHSSVAIGLVFLAGLFLGMLLFLEVGRRIRLGIAAKGEKDAVAGLNVVEGSLFGLMGLVIAFTFSGAASRFDAKRHLIVEEANSIGTAYRRIDLLPEASRPQLREEFRRYVDARLETYRSFQGSPGAFPRIEAAAEIQREMWDQSVAATRDAANPQAAMLLLPSLNARFDIANTRYWVTQTHPPPIIYALLAILALLCSLLAGFGMAGGRARSWFHIVAFAAILTATIYVIIDMEYPRIGLIRLDAFDQALLDVRAEMR